MTKSFNRFIPELSYARLKVPVAVVFPSPVARNQVHAQLFCSAEVPFILSRRNSYFELTDFLLVKGRLEQGVHKIVSPSTLRLVPFKARATKFRWTGLLGNLV